MIRFLTEVCLFERDGRVSSGVIWRMHFWLLCTVVWCWWQECSLLEWCKPAGDAEPDSTVCWRIGAGVSSSRNTSRDAASVRGGKKHQSQVQSYRLVTTQPRLVTRHHDHVSCQQYHFLCQCSVELPSLIIARRIWGMRSTPLIIWFTVSNWEKLWWILKTCIVAENQVEETVIFHFHIRFRTRVGLDYVTIQNWASGTLSRITLSFK